MGKMMIIQWIFGTLSILLPGRGVEPCSRIPALIQSATWWSAAFRKCPGVQKTRLGIKSLRATDIIRYIIRYIRFCMWWSWSWMATSANPRYSAFRKVLWWIAFQDLMPEEWRLSGKGLFCPLEFCAAHCLVACGTKRKSCMMVLTWILALSMPRWWERVACRCLGIPLWTLVFASFPPESLPKRALWPTRTTQLGGMKRGWPTKATGSWFQIGSSENRKHPEAPQNGKLNLEEIMW